jgi:hypothetical protein
MGNFAYLAKTATRAEAAVAIKRVLTQNKSSISSGADSDKRDTKTDLPAMRQSLDSVVPSAPFCRQASMFITPTVRAAVTGVQVWAVRS